MTNDAATKMKKMIPKILFAIIMLWGCKAIESRNCLEEYTHEERVTQETKIVLQALQDTIQARGSRRIPYMESLQKNRWEAEYVLFNRDFDKCITAVCIVYSSTQSKFDDIKYVTGERKGSSWDFYFASMPVVVMNRNNNKGQPYSLAQLQEVISEEFRSRFFGEENGCENPDYGFVDDWFTPQLKLHHAKQMKSGGEEGSRN